LLIHRTRRPDDHHAGKFNGLGGKMEPSEDVVACMRREIREEAGIECDELLLRGTISWPGFGKNGEDWFGFIFRIDRWHGEVKPRNDEGTLDWIDVDQIMTLPLWEGDRFFLPHVFGSATRQFHGVMPYRDGRPLSWSVSFLPESDPQIDR
jgi:8-oxo-dGTP diphosphatase